MDRGDFLRTLAASVAAPLAKHLPKTEEIEPELLPEVPNTEAVSYTWSGGTGNNQVFGYATSTEGMTGNATAWVSVTSTGWSNV